MIPSDAHVIIIGAMKCGTTSLYQHLERHPAICGAITKEPEYFSHSQGHGACVERYANLWPHFNHRYALEASTGYTKYPAEDGIPRRMRESGIRPKLLYIVRNPFERIESHWQFQRYFGGRLNPRWRHGITGPHLVAISSYHMQLERYRQYFDQSDILVLDFEELRAPERMLRKVYGFLGLSYHWPEQQRKTNGRQPVSALQAHAERLGISDMLPAPVRRAGKRLLHRISPPTVRTLTARQRQHVHEALEGDMARLARDYGVDVARWGFTPSPPAAIRSVVP